MLVGSTVSENEIDIEKANLITEASNRKIPASRLSAGDLVTVRVGEPGITAVIPPELDGCNCASMMIVRKKDSFNSNWLCFLMNSDFGLSQIRNVQYGTAQKQFNISDAVGFLYPYPELVEQTAIANALSDVDALITSLEKFIDKKRAIKTAAMQQLLTGKKRLPPFDTLNSKKGTSRYKQTELGEIPEDWEVKPIGSALSIRHGRDQKEVEKQDGIYPVMGTGGEIGRTNTFLYDKPSVLIGRKGTINKPVYMESPFWTVDTLFYSEISEKFSGKFIYYKFCLIDWMAYNEASGVPSLNASTIERILQSFPLDRGEQVAIASVLSDMDKEIDVLEQRLNKTQQLKQGMMQELLTGRTRLV